MINLYSMKGPTTILASLGARIMIVVLLSISCSYSTHVYESTGSLLPSDDKPFSQASTFKVQQDVSHPTVGSYPSNRLTKALTLELSDREKNTLSEAIQNIQALKPLDLAIVYTETKQMSEKCKFDGMNQKYFRRPRDGNHSSELYDPSLVLGFLFDDERCVEDPQEPGTERCMFLKRNIDETGREPAIRFYLTSRTAPFRIIFENVAKYFSHLARTYRIVGKDQDIVRIEPEVVNFKIDCDLQMIDFASQISGADETFDGYTISVNEPKRGMVYHSNIFIDLSRLLESQSQPDVFFSALQRVFAHELGHALGMADNKSKITESIMNIYPESDERSLETILYPYDLATLIFIYSKTYSPSILWYVGRDGQRYLWDLVRQEHEMTI
ncbi:MAG: hypothetical protein KDD48_00170 [Bdellovibrionales bacterium]|nr:hypothetical protein [Bdellovibrionales bacterium]